MKSLSLKGAEGLWIATGGSKFVGAQCSADPDASLQHQGVGVEGVVQPAQGGQSPALSQGPGRVEPASSSSEWLTAGGCGSSGSGTFGTGQAKELEKPGGVGGAVGGGRV